MNDIYSNESAKFAKRLFQFRVLEKKNMIILFNAIKIVSFDTDVDLI